jgi:hypothetical protein
METEIKITKSKSYIEKENLITDEEIEEPWINCLILTQFPNREKMIQQAIASFLEQDYKNKVLTIISDGYQLFSILHKKIKANF